MATTLYGALLGLWLVVLSFRVIALRVVQVWDG